MSKEYRFRGPFHKQHGKRAQPLLESEWERLYHIYWSLFNTVNKPKHLKSKQQHLYHIYWSLWRQLTRKKFLLMKCKNLRLFVNTMTVDNKYAFLIETINLLEPIQILLSEKQIIFSQLFFKYLKSVSNFEHFQKKDAPESWCISKITDSEKRGQIIV